MRAAVIVASPLQGLPCTEAVAIFHMCSEIACNLGFSSNSLKRLKTVHLDALPNLGVKYCLGKIALNQKNPLQLVVLKKKKRIGSGYG